MCFSEKRLLSMTARRAKRVKRVKQGRNHSMRAMVAAMAHGHNNALVIIGPP